jgi:hypothetical protein
VKGTALGSSPRAPGIVCVARRPTISALRGDRVLPRLLRDRRQVGPFEAGPRGHERDLRQHDDEHEGEDHEQQTDQNGE